MTTDSNLTGIREKIYKLRTAIMYSMSNDLVKMPNSIITAVKVDEEGQLWFVSKSHLQNLDQCEQSFPVRLHFFRKGTNFFVVVSGKAFIVNNSEAALNGHGALETNQEKPILIKIKTGGEMQEL